MPKDDRNLLEVLKFELEFLEQGGYGRLPRESWRPRFVFEDSPTCMNFNSKDHDPCEECLLMQFVPAGRAHRANSMHSHPAVTERTNARIFVPYGDTAGD